MSDSERAAHELAAVPLLGLSVAGLQLLTGWDSERATAALRSLLDSGQAQGRLSGHITLLYAPQQAPARHQRGATTVLRYQKGTTAIAACGWDAGTRTLELVFRANLRLLYRFHDVAAADGEGMAAAMGCADRMDVFRATIKDKYAFTRVPL